MNTNIGLKITTFDDRPTWMNIRATTLRNFENESQK